MTPSSSELRVSDLMTRSVRTLTASQSLPLAESLMELLHVRHIPVVDEEGKLVGLVTHRDLLAAKISSLAPLSDDERSSLQLVVPVSKIMRREVWSIGPDAMAVAATRIMREHAFGCLPVVEDGVLVGILTEADLLAVVTDSLALDRPVQSWTVERVMTRVPVTITSDATITEARAAMTRYKIRHLPITEHGKPIGLVCDRELSVAEAIFKDGEHASAAHVTGLLGRGRFRRVAPTTSLDSILGDMFDDRLEAVLVVDNGVLVGIFTAFDACRLCATFIGGRKPAVAGLRYAARA